MKRKKGCGGWRLERLLCWGGCDLRSGKGMPQGKWRVSYVVHRFFDVVYAQLLLLSTCVVVVEEGRLNGIFRKIRKAAATKGKDRIGWLPVRA